MAKPSITGHLESLLRRTLHDDTLIFGEIASRSGKFYSIRSCRGYKHFYDEDINHNLVLFPFRVIGSNDYWLSVSLKYNVWSKKVEHVSIVFFEMDLHKMFRADWGNNESTEHGQPHWHIHNRKPDLDSPLWNAEAIKIFPSEVEEMVNDKIKRIHFAMSSTWHLNSNSFKNISECQDNEVLQWVEGVLLYVTKQLNYLHDKSKV